MVPDPQRYFGRIFDQQGFKVFLAQILAGLVFVGLSAPAAGQGLGLVGGANFTSVDDVDYGSAQATFDNKTGYHLGAYLRLGAGPLDLRPGIRYLNAGPIFEGLDEGIGNGGLDDSFDVSFISVPIDVALNLPAPIVTPYIFAGPEFRFQRAPDAPEALEDEINEWSYIGNLGIGAKISLGEGGLTLSPEIRYSFGLSDLIDEEFTYGNETFVADDQRRSESFFISLGIEP